MTDEDVTNLALLEVDSDIPEDILRAIEEENDTSVDSISMQRQETQTTEQSSLFSNGVWGNSVLSCNHTIPVDNFVDRTQNAPEERMKEIKEDATLDQIKEFLTNNNLDVFKEALNKMRKDIRRAMGPNLSLAQKKHYNTLSMRNFLNKNATCRTING